MSPTLWCAVRSYYYINMDADVSPQHDAAVTPSCSSSVMCFPQAEVSNVGLHGGLQKSRSVPTPPNLVQTNIVGCVQHRVSSEYFTDPWGGWTFTIVQFPISVLSTKMKKKNDMTKKVYQRYVSYITNVCTMYSNRLLSWSTNACWGYCPVIITVVNR